MDLQLFAQVALIFQQCFLLFCGMRYECQNKEPFPGVMGQLTSHAITAAMMYWAGAFSRIF